jgi:threonine synthase
LSRGDEIPARNIEREMGLRQIFLKFEGGNPTGTQKDRIAFAQAMDAMRRGFDTITMATCGNYGVAVALAVPASNGTTLAGIYRGFFSLYRRGKTSRMPRMVAGSAFRKNPIVQAFLRNLSTCEDLKPEQIHETSINEPLINWHAMDGDHALEAMRLTSGWAANASDKAMRNFSNLVRTKEGLQILPASTAGIIALMEKHGKDPLPNDRCVVVLTGRKS